MDFLEKYLVINMAKKINYASMFTLRKDGRYQGSYTDDTGRHYVYGRDPEKLWHKLQTAVNKSPSVPTFEEVADEWQREHVEKLERGTQKTYKAPIENAIAQSGKMLITEITAGDIDRELKREKQEGLSYKHAATLKSIYKQIFDLAIVKGYISSNPVLSVKVPRGMPRGRREAPEDEIVKKIETGLDAPFGDFVAILFYTGMRTEEAAALRWEDVDFEGGIISIRRAADLHGTPIIKEAKTEAGYREIPILPQLERHLKRPKSAKNSDYIFNANGKMLTRGQLTSRWLGWCKAVGLAAQKTYDNRHRGKRECTRTEWRPMVTPHQLRHNYATVLYEADVDELTAKDLMGHADIATTRAIYTSLRKKHRAEEIEKIKKAF